uniref:recombinase RecT n=1 Tax=Levilactobacillus namurensis TaxID=380393 RepID=UPI0026EDF91B
MANELVVSVQNEINNMQKNGGLKLPNNYSVGNALNAAWLDMSAPDKHGQSILDKCDPQSISKSLLDMSIQGLSPAKKQCYFIAYGNQCSLQRSYFGSTVVLKQLSSVDDIRAQVFFEGDEFEIGSDDDMNLVVTKYHPKFENRDNPIAGAFAYILQTDGTKVWTVMTKKEIDASWSQGRSHDTQKKFPQEMARRTVTNRAAKMYINTSTDNDLLVKAINDTTEAEYSDDQPAKDVTPKKTVDDLIGDGSESSTVASVNSSSEASESAQQSDSVSGASEIASESVSESEASASS